MNKDQRTDFNDVHWDVLKEVSNIGTGNAIRALSSFLNNSISLNQPYIRMLDYEDVLNRLGGSDNVVVGLLLFLSGDIDGMIMLLLQEEFTLESLSILMGEHYEDLYEVDEMGSSALKELGNIMAASYINAIASLSNMSIHLSVPSIATDMIGSILSVPTIHFADISNRVLFMENEFSLGEHHVNSSILLFAKDESIKRMMTNLGIEIQ